MGASDHETVTDNVGDRVMDGGEMGGVAGTVTVTCAAAEPAKRAMARKVNRMLGLVGVLESRSGTT